MYLEEREAGGGELGDDGDTSNIGKEEAVAGPEHYSRTSVQRNSLSRTSRLAGRWLDWTSGRRGQKNCIVSRKLTFNLYFSAIS